MVSIRCWNQADIQSCLHLVQRDEIDISWGCEQYQHSFQAGHCGFIAEEGDQVLGCLVAVCLYETADLLFLQVCPYSRRKGIARQLVLQFMAYCQRQCVERILLEVRRSNLGARAFYRSLGFVDIAVRKQYYKSTENREQEDAYILQRLL